MRHKLLARQLRQALGIAGEQAIAQRLDDLRAKGEGELVDGLLVMLSGIEQSYTQFERDLEVRTRMLDISSAELMSANEQLREEAARQREVLLSLQSSVHRLTGTTVQQRAQGAQGSDDDLLGLTRALEELVQQREAARDALAATEAANRRILNSLREVVFQTDIDGNWVYLNPAWYNITGFPLADSLGQRALGFLHTDDQRATAPRLQALAERREHFLRQHMRFRTRGGGFRWLEVFAARLENEEGELVGLSGSLIDISPMWIRPGWSISATRWWTRRASRSNGSASCTRTMCCAGASICANT